jgi:hypothetical protein
MGQCRWKWPVPWQWWHLMYNVHPVGTVDEEGFPAAVAAPYKIEDLLGTIAWGAIEDGVNDVKGAWEAEGVIGERAPEGVAVLDGAVGAEQGVKVVFIFVIWQPCNSFSANIASWNK